MKLLHGLLLNSATFVGAACPPHITPLNPSTSSRTFTYGYTYDPGPKCTTCGPCDKVNFTYIYNACTGSEIEHDKHETVPNTDSLDKLKWVEFCFAAVSPKKLTSFNLVWETCPSGVLSGDPTPLCGSALDVSTKIITSVTYIGSNYSSCGTDVLLTGIKLGFSDGTSHQFPGGEGSEVKTTKVTGEITFA